MCYRNLRCCRYFLHSKSQSSWVGWPFPPYYHRDFSKVEGIQERRCVSCSQGKEMDKPAKYRIRPLPNWRNRAEVFHQQTDNLLPGKVAGRNCLKTSDTTLDLAGFPRGMPWPASHDEGINAWKSEGRRDSSSAAKMCYEMLRLGRWMGYTSFAGGRRDMGCSESSC